MHCARTDGIICPEDSCDIDDGIWSPPRLTAGALKSEIRAMAEPTEVPTETSTLKPTVNSLEEYQAKLAAAKGPVLLDFIMDGCGHCEEETPAFEKLVKDCDGNDATLMRIEITQPWALPLADKLNVTGTPTALLAQNVKDLEAGKVREVFELDSDSVRKKLKCAR